MSEQIAMQPDKFEIFKKMVEESNPDMSKIKEYIIENPELLSDYKKFSDLVFPKASDNDKAAKFTALENTITALSELKENGELKDGMLENFAALRDTNGRNASAFLQEFAGTINAEDNPNKLQQVRKMQDLLNDVYKDKPQLLAAKQEETFRIGGEEKPQNGGVTIDGNQNDGVTIDGQLPPAKPAENKTANITPDNTEAEKKPRKPLDIKPVKEQDIIDYMFNDWFLASINWLIKKAYGILDKGIDWLSAKSEVPPKSSFSGKGTARTEQDYENLQLLNQLVDEYPKNLLKEFDKNKEAFAQLYGIDPTHLQQDEKGMKKFIKYAALVAVPLYMDGHTKGNPLKDDEERNKLNKIMKQNLGSIFTSCKQINALYANDEEVAAKEIITYFRDLSSASKEMKADLVDYYKESDKDEKLKKQQKVAASRQELEQVLGRYENPETQETAREHASQDNVKHTLDEEAKHNNAVDTQLLGMQNYVERNREQYTSTQEAHLARQKAFFALKAKKFPNLVEKSVNNANPNEAFQQAIISSLNTGR